jgi:hypothetical protein
MSAPAAFVEAENVTVRVLPGVSDESANLMYWDWETFGVVEEDWVPSATKPEVPPFTVALPEFVTIRYSASPGRVPIGTANLMLVTPWPVFVPGVPTRVIDDTVAFARRAKVSVQTKPSVNSVFFMMSPLRI